jgi:hypothetical protein
MVNGDFVQCCIAGVCCLSLFTMHEQFPMLEQFLWTIALTAVTVALHTAYSFYAFRAIVRRQHVRFIPHLGEVPHRVFLVVVSVVLLLLLHCLEATLWAVHYVHAGSLPDFATALYFSILSYATIGYGDVVLPVQARLIGAMEGMVGTMMAGWSVALIVATLQVTAPTPQSRSRRTS